MPEDGTGRKQKLPFEMGKKKMEDGDWGTDGSWTGQKVKRKKQKSTGSLDGFSRACPLNVAKINAEKDSINRELRG